MTIDHYCEKCDETYSVDLITCPKCEMDRWKKANADRPWTEQFFECVTIGPEPPLNTKGFWDKPEVEEIEIVDTD